MSTQLNDELANIQTAFSRARAEKQAYAHLLPMLEALFTHQVRARCDVRLSEQAIDPESAKIKWKDGIPLLHRWNFPVDPDTSESLLAAIGPSIPEKNSQMRRVHELLSRTLVKQHQERDRIWQSFLHHEMEPWEEWFAVEEEDLPSLLFLARSCLRPSIEKTARRLREQLPLPAQWLKGYCPVCGSLPSLLFLQGTGEKMGYCSWCGTQWGLHRLQCPLCDNRDHQQLGYLFFEEERHYRIPYCSLCGTYFKLIDAREWTEPPYFPLEEWITLHLDLLAQKAGWKPAPSPSPQIYGRKN